MAVVLVLTGWAVPVSAARVHAHVSGYGYPGDVSAFDLHVARTDLELDYEDSADDKTLRLRRVGIALFEPVSDSTRLGVRLGRIGFDQSGRPATAGRDPTGYFLELEFDGAWPADTRLRAALGANWRYASTDETEDDEEVEVDWQVIELRTALWLSLNPRLAVRLGASAIAVDGTERVSGVSRQTVDFEAAGTAGGFATLEYHRSDGDVIAARVRGGNPAGLYVSFEHRY